MHEYSSLSKCYSMANICLIHKMSDNNKFLWIYLSVNSIFIATLHVLISADKVINKSACCCFLIWLRTIGNNTFFITPYVCDCLINLLLSNHNWLESTYQKFYRSVLKTFWFDCATDVLARIIISYRMCYHFEWGR